LIHFVDQFVAQTCQTDDSDLPNWWPKTSGWTSMFDRVWVQFSITQLNQVEYGSTPNPAQLMDNPNCSPKAFGVVISLSKQKVKVIP